MLCDVRGFILYKCHKLFYLPGAESQADIRLTPGDPLFGSKHILRLLCVLGSAPPLMVSGQL